MSYQVLSRKWRPKTFQDVIGQEHVTRSLQNSIIQNRLGHAYVLTGTRGIGKTSVARIFAKSLRCLERKEDANPCGHCRSCLEFEESASMNVLEMDGASNNSVDDIRALVGSVQTLPTYGEYKVYIIDEVHMLSVSAFNALLKTLEEPPAHVIFLMATTEPHKLPETVLSRCQRFDFKNASIELLEKHLVKIAKKENISFENEMIPHIIAGLGQGSFRDTLSLLDQVLSFSTDNNVSEEVLSTALGIAKTSTIKALMMALLLEEVDILSDRYQNLLIKNISLENITKAILDMLYNVIQSIDKLELLDFSDIEKQNLEQISIDELFWIYEGLCRDFSWGVTSLCSEKTIEIILQKYSMRSNLLTAKTHVEKKKIIKAEEKIILKTWPDFEKELQVKLPAFAAELFHGNLIGEANIRASSVLVTYGFSKGSKLFYDQLMQGDAKDKVEGLMRSFFQKESAKISFEEVGEDESFKSQAEIAEKKEQDVRDKKLTDFKNHPAIKEAEEIFGSKIDRVRIRE